MPVSSSVHWKPLRDSHYVVASLEPGQGGRRLVFIDQSALIRIQALARGAPGHHILGLLIGGRWECPITGTGYSLIESVVESQPAPYADALGPMLAELVETSEDRNAGEPLGWYFGAPALERRLHDREAAIHTALFPQPWQTVLAVTNTASDGAFYLYDRSAARWFQSPFFEVVELTRKQTTKATCLSWPTYLTTDVVATLPMAAPAPSLGARLAATVAAAPPPPAIERPTSRSVLRPAPPPVERPVPAADTTRAPAERVAPRSVLRPAPAPTERPAPPAVQPPPAAAIERPVVVPPADRPVAPAIERPAPPPIERPAAAHTERVLALPVQRAASPAPVERVVELPIQRLTQTPPPHRLAPPIAAPAPTPTPRPESESSAAPPPVARPAPRAPRLQLGHPVITRERSRALEQITGAVRSASRSAWAQLRGASSRLGRALARVEPAVRKSMGTLGTSMAHAASATATASAGLLARTRDASSRLVQREVARRAAAAQARRDAAVAAAAAAAARAAATAAPGPPTPTDIGIIPFPAQQTASARSTPTNRPADVRVAVTPKAPAAVASMSQADSDDTAATDTPFRYLGLASREGFVVIAKPEGAGTDQSEFWLLEEPDSGLLLAVIASARRVLEATLHYNQRTDNDDVLRGTAPEFRDLASRTIYLREPAIERLRARCRRLRASGTLVREWKVSPPIDLPHPSRARGNGSNRDPGSGAHDLAAGNGKPRGLPSSN